MADILSETLGWLLPAPHDFRAQLKAVAADGSVPDAATLMHLSSFALDIDRLTQLDRLVARSRDRLAAGRLSPLRLAILADGTTDYVAPAIRASALRHGILVDTYVPAYGQGLAEAMNPDSDLARFAPDVALVAFDHRLFGLDRAQMDPALAAAAVTAAIDSIRTIVAALARNRMTVIVQTLPVPADPWCGHLDRMQPGSPAAQVIAVNAGVVQIVADHGAILLDADALAASVGRSRWFDAAWWHRAKVPFALDLMPLYADHVGRILGALRGKARKCLVLDLDNTLWGGVIGDDGLDGIRIGQGSGDGEAYLAVQAAALSLKARGVVLAVVSKNEEDAARLPFRQHPDMLLREDDIAVFIANWNDKATNIAHVARTLNIGTDALVFLDDNPAERTRVRQMLPEVAVPELPEDPGSYAPLLMRSGLFETVGLSEDDAKRAEQYRQNASRTQALEQLGDYDAYLSSLDMVCDLAPFDAVGRTRIAQLVNKSNQFNVTTRRYTEADIAALEADPACFTLQVRLTDRFGDNGMISVVIFRAEGHDWVCDTWLMSCRVLKRRVEEAVLAAVAQAARKAGATRLVGVYIPSEKNRMVADLFPRLGFTAQEGPQDDSGARRWVLELPSYAMPDLPLHLTGAQAPAARIPA